MLVLKAEKAAAKKHSTAANRKAWFRASMNGVSMALGKNVCPVSTSRVACGSVETIEPMDCNNVPTGL